MIHREFGPILNWNRWQTPVPGEQAKLSGRRFWDRKTHRRPITLPDVNLDSNSEINLVEMQKFGGIMVSQEVSVDVGDPSSGRLRQGSDDELGTTGEAVKEVEDAETYVDKLLAVCIKARG
jgi:hypothetical protein